jgi:hypothetical protein
MSDLSRTVVVPLTLFTGGTALGAIAMLWLQYGPSIFLTMIETGLRYCF